MIDFACFTEAADGRQAVIPLVSSDARFAPPTWPGLPLLFSYLADSAVCCCA